MRGYGKKIIGNALRRESNIRTETKDAILWEILDDDRKASVKIQGSNKQIFAHYPQNWDVRPSWCKPGNAVKIMHTGGNRGRIELVGHGGYIPTPIIGDPFPTAEQGIDCVLSGCEILQMTPIPLMMVRVTAGSYRIAGTTYYLGAFGSETGYMPLGSGMPLGTGYPLGTIGAYGIEISPAPLSMGLFRYDRIVVGIDGAVDYIEGEEFINTPVYPEIPEGHVSLAMILLYGGITEITQDLINREWEERRPAAIQITPDDGELAWGEDSTETAILVQDQYGQPLNTDEDNPYMIQIQFIYGTGVSWGAATPGGAPVIYSTILNPSHAVYTRDTGGDEHSPILRADLISEHSAFGVIMIILLDVAGDALY